jgi:hypothetical protein
VAVFATRRERAILILAHLSHLDHFPNGVCLHAFCKRKIPCSGTFPTAINFIIEADIFVKMFELDGAIELLAILFPFASLLRSIDFADNLHFLSL